MKIEGYKKLDEEAIRAALPAKIREMKILFMYAQDYESATIMRRIEKKYLGEEIETEGLWDDTAGKT